jgi:PDZ domain
VKPRQEIQFVCLLGLFLVLPCFAATPTASLQEATAADVRDCKPLGQVLGESHVCSKTRAKRDAVRQAEALGGTHIVWLSSRCVFGAGEKATALVFDCQPQISLDADYEDFTVGPGAVAAETVPFQGPTRLMTSANLDGDALDLNQRGYVLIGYVGLSGSRVTPAAIRSKGQAVGAEVALVAIRNAGSQTEFQSVTTYSGGGLGMKVGFGSASGNAAGSNINIVGSGTSLSTNPGESHTSFVPYSQRSFDTQILFWRKRRPDRLGLYLDVVPVGMRSALGRNTGAYVSAVEEQSPAFLANVLIGDVVIAGNNHEIRTPAELEQLLATLGDQAVSLTVLRNGKALEIPIGKPE